MIKKGWESSLSPQFRDKFAVIPWGLWLLLDLVLESNISTEKFRRWRKQKNYFKTSATLWISWTDRAHCWVRTNIQFDSYLIQTPNLFCYPLLSEALYKWALNPFKNHRNKRALLLPSPGASPAQTPNNLGEVQTQNKPEWNWKTAEIMAVSKHYR